MSFESESWSHKLAYGTDYDQDGQPQAEDLCLVCGLVDCECPPELGNETPSPRRIYLTNFLTMWQQLNARRICDLPINTKTNV